MNSTASGNLLRFEITRVGLLQQADARVGAKAGIDLPVPGIDGQYAGGAVLQHAVGKAAGGGAHIHAHGAVQGDAPVPKRGLQFEASPADVPRIGAEQTELAIIGHGMTGLVNLLLVHQYASGQNHSLRPLAGGGKSTLHQKNVNSLLHRFPCFSGLSLGHATSSDLWDMATRTRTPRMEGSRTGGCAKRRRANHYNAVTATLVEFSPHFPHMC